jgi:hypothetical protein
VAIPECFGGTALGSSLLSVEAQFMSDFAKFMALCPLMISTNPIRQLYAE